VTVLLQAACGASVLWCLLTALRAAALTMSWDTYFEDCGVPERDDSATLRPRSAYDLASLRVRGAACQGSMIILPAGEEVRSYD
jgi:hypothetical protein